MQIMEPNNDISTKYSFWYATFLFLGIVYIIYWNVIEYIKASDGKQVKYAIFFHFVAPTKPLLQTQLQDQQYR